MSQTVKRAFKFRFYPTPEQAEELARTFGCVRLVYNKALEERTRTYTMEGRRVSYVQSSAALTEWKRSPELAFLNEVSSVPLQQALRHLQELPRATVGTPSLQEGEKVNRPHSPPAPQPM
ncbi:hypothetical protein GCM10023194_18230 [Planotetraspora phitsanulokensis]|uniref:Transposase putative helix-turn-helix domain-containing protein n=1 Tax=Planotetraspora phitsanulokensis TaxID=575192 RepID=A0A8J3TYZ9_9ACTN|nr:hypothetical protein Pph01_01870 [Planotetraspora phitsanulokensis]